MITAAACCHDTASDADPGGEQLARVCIITYIVTRLQVCSPKALLLYSHHTYTICSARVHVTRVAYYNVYSCPVTSAHSVHYLCIKPTRFACGPYRRAHDDYRTGFKENVSLNNVIFSFHPRLSFRILSLARTIITLRSITT